MTAKLLDGKKTASKYIELFKETITNLKSKYKKVPTLAVILVGDNPASLIYVKNKQKRCDEIGINSLSIHLPNNTSETELLKTITK